MASEQKLSPAHRKKARRLAVQALYQWHVAGQAISQIEAEFIADNDMTKVDQPYFTELLRTVVASHQPLDELISGHIDRPLKDLTPVELAILRLGTYELMHRLDVPYRVVINEGVELSKTFGANEAHKFVNGVLDKLARQLRKTEQTARSTRTNPQQNN